MNELALFAGAGGGILASNLLGINTICAVERDDFCRHILLMRQNDRILDTFPIWDEIRTFDGTPWRGSVDIVSGGFPCQAFSTAARGRNINEKDLWGEMLRVIREVSPNIVFAENVSRKAIEKAKEDLLAIGFKSNIIELSAKDLGADHIRKRYWLFAYTNDYSELCSTKYAEAQELPKFRYYFWNTEPRELRVPDELAYRMDKLKALGNGQVPIVAGKAFIRGYEMMLEDKLWE